MEDNAQLLQDAKNAHKSLAVLIAGLEAGEVPNERLLEKIVVDLKTAAVGVMVRLPPYKKG